MQTNHEDPKQQQLPSQSSSPLILIDQIDNLDKHLHSTFRSIASIINYNLQVKNLNIAPFIEQPNPRRPPKELLDSLKQNVLNFDHTLEHMERLTTLSIAILQRDLTKARELERIRKETEAQLQAMAPMTIDKPSDNAPTDITTSKTPISIQEDDEDDQPLASYLPPPTKNPTTIDLTTPTPSPQPQPPSQRPPNNTNNPSTSNLKSQIDPTSLNAVIPSASPTGLAVSAAQTPKPSEAVAIKLSPAESNSLAQADDKAPKLAPSAPARSTADIDRDSSPETALSTAPLTASKISKEIGANKTIDQSNNNEAISSGAAVEIKSTSDITDGDLFGDGSLFGSSQHGSVGPSPLNQPANLNNPNLIEKDEVLMTSDPPSGSIPQPPVKKVGTSAVTLAANPSDRKATQVPEQNTSSKLNTSPHKLNDPPSAQESTAANLIIHPQLNSTIDQVSSSTSATALMSQQNEEELNKFSTSIDLLATQADLSAFLANFPNLSSATDPSLTSPQTSLATNLAQSIRRSPISPEKADQHSLLSSTSVHPSSSTTGLVGLGINLNPNHNASQPPNTDSTNAITANSSTSTSNAGLGHLHPNLTPHPLNVHQSSPSMNLDLSSLLSQISPDPSNLK